MGAGSVADSERPTFPNISIEEAKRQLGHQDRVLRSFPEVESVFGKVGRAESATDPAPITMVETTVRLKPPAAWRTVAEKRWYSGWAPGWLKAALHPLWPERRPLTWDELTAEMNARMQFPGWTNAWTMPIKTRVDMLSTGVRTPVGVKVFAGDLGEVERVGTALEQIINAVPGTRSVLYERNLGGLYLDVVPRAADLARFGLRVGDVQQVIETAIGGAPVTETVEGRNRFTINVRYPQDMRGDQEALRRVLVPIPGGAAGHTAFVSLAEVADIRIAAGPPMLRDEAGQLVGYVYVDIDQQSRDLGGYVDDAKAAVARALADGTLKLGSGTYLKWTGQYEQLALMTARMKLVIPLTLLIIVLLLYAQFRDVGQVLIILLSIPFALVGSAWLLWLLDYRLSTAVWVGIIALAGLAAQTGIVMIVYINQAFARRKAEGRIDTLEDIIDAHMGGTVQRVRPKLMTVATMLVGLVPLLWAQSSGADVMKRIAAPMVGGLLTSAFLTLEIIPVVVTAYRFEQLLWERLRQAAPGRLGGLRLAAIAIAAGGAGAAALGVARLYVAFPGRGFAAGALGAALLFLSGCAVYAVRRPAAKRLVWPT